MKTVGTFEEVRDLAVGPVSFIPTMGFLHEGHLSLIEAAARTRDTVVVSLFVNPLQFSEASDLAAYPRDLDRDLELAREAGADLFFAPDVAEMYPSEPVTTVTVAGVSEGMEGDHRPGHFSGVATVVAKLFAGIQPKRAYFGRKDAQQLAVVRTMTEELSLPVDVRGMPIVRESDGLALSSRNVRISEGASRSSAAMLSSALYAAGDAFDRGERRSVSLRSIATGILTADPSIDVEYVEVANAGDASPIEQIDRLSFLALAATIDGVRLIDNVHLDPDTGLADRGTRLDAPSILYGRSDAADN